LTDNLLTQNLNGYLAITMTQRCADGTKQSHFRCEICTFWWKTKAFSFKI